MEKRFMSWLAEPVAQLGGGRLRSFAISADKATELRRTSQHVAMLVMVRTALSPPSF